MVSSIIRRSIQLRAAIAVGCDAIGTSASMAAAADAEDKTEKHPVTPGPLSPARELYGSMKKVTGLIKLQVPAGKANPSPPVGPALGQHGVNIMGW